MLSQFQNDARFAVFWTGVYVGVNALFALPTTRSLAMASIGFAVLATIIILSASRAGNIRTFGAANVITTFRLGIVAVLIGATGSAAAALETWWPATIAGLALMLDGFDGVVARRKGLESSFGALFDQETDALLILVMTLLLAVSGKIGWWIVAAGLMRYVLLAAGMIWPSLTEPLPKSRLRRSICGVLVSTLAVCTLPQVTPIYASALATAALSVLTLSFAKDLIWLLKQAPGRTHA